MIGCPGRCRKKLCACCEAVLPELWGDKRVFCEAVAGAHVFDKAILAGAGKSSGPSVRLRCLEIGGDRPAPTRERLGGATLVKKAGAPTREGLGPTLVKKGAGSNS